MTRVARPDPAVAVLLLAPLLLGWSFFDPFHEHVEKGNAKAEKGDPSAAVTEYDSAARVRPSSPIPDFNKGVALAETGDTDAARDALLAAAASQDPAIAADALYNLGNVYLDQQRFGEAVESYLRSLDLDATDPDARRNLEIAIQRLEQQQQQRQQQSQDQNQDQNQEDQTQPQPPQDPQDQPPPSDQQQPEPSPADSTRTQTEERFSREDAERLLNAIQSDELKVLDALRRRDPDREVSANDW